MPLMRPGWRGFSTTCPPRWLRATTPPPSPTKLLMTAKQFIGRLAEMKLIPLPGNIRSRRFRFNHSVAARIETFTVEEVRELLASCDGFSERTKLYLLLMLNCGMYQNDIAELRQRRGELVEGHAEPGQEQDPGARAVRSSPTSSGRRPSPCSRSTAQQGQLRCPGARDCSSSMGRRSSPARSSTRVPSTRTSCWRSAAAPRPSSTSSARCRRSTSPRASTSTTSTSS